jgi:hypothetical protein
MRNVMGFMPFATSEEEGASRFVPVFVSPFSSFLPFFLSLPSFCSDAPVSALCFIRTDSLPSHAGARRILRALPLPSTSSLSPSSHELSTLFLSRPPSSASTIHSLAILSGLSTAPLDDVLKTLEQFSPAVKALSSEGEQERWERLMEKLAPSKEEMDGW